MSLHSGLGGREGPCKNMHAYLSFAPPPPTLPAQYVNQAPKGSYGFLVHVVSSISGAARLKSYLTDQFTNTGTLLLIRKCPHTMFPRVSWDLTNAYSARVRMRMSRLPLPRREALWSVHSHPTIQSSQLKEIANRRRHSFLLPKNILWVYLYMFFFIAIARSLSNEWKYSGCEIEGRLITGGELERLTDLLSVIKAVSPR